VAFDAGPVVQLTAPCLLEIRDRDRAYLHHGQVRTESAGTSPGFNLETPTSALTDRGTQADVKVHDDGATDVLVYQGELEMEARALDGSPTDQVRIGIGGHKHVAAVSKSNQPLDRTHFKGVLRVNGETREFSNKDEYEQARRRLMEEFEKFQQNLPKALAPREMQGQIEINGKKTEVNSLESILEVQRKLLEQFSRMNVPSNPAGKGKQDFKGQININGQRFDFMNPQSFDEFRRRLLQPMNPPQRPSPR
jgi:hypothetical protein